MSALAVACRVRITHCTQDTTRIQSARCCCIVAVVCKQEKRKKSTEAEIFYTFFGVCFIFCAALLLLFLFLFLFCVVPAMQSSGRCIKREKTQSTAAAVAAAACLQVAPGGVQRAWQAGRQRDRQTGRQTGSVVHDGAGLKGLRRSVRNPHNYPFIGLGATVAAVAVAVRERGRSRWALTEAISCITQHFFLLLLFGQLTFGYIRQSGVYALHRPVLPTICSAVGFCCAHCKRCVYVTLALHSYGNHFYEVSVFVRTVFFFLGTAHTGRRDEGE